VPARPVAAPRPAVERRRMATRTSIEWLAPDGTPGKSWNFLRGCTRVSPGCGTATAGGCYAEAIAARFSDPGHAFHGLAVRTPAGPRWTGEVRYVPRLVREPLRWRTPTWVFVNSMSDLAHPEVQAHWIDQMLEVIKATPWHVYIALTKRPERLWRLLYAEQPDACVRVLQPDESLPNLILGTSVESSRYLGRLEALLAAWPGRTVVSAEPLLGPLDLTRWLDPCPFCGERRLDWVLAGGESGPQARPCAVEWLAALRDQCAAAQTPYFLKQLGRRPYAHGPGCDGCYGHGELPGATGCPFCGELRLKDRKGADPAEWDPALRVREFPTLEGR